MRFVIDTNTLVSAFLWNGAPAKLLQELRSKNHDIYSSEILLTELTEVLKRTKFISQLNRVNQTPNQLIDQWLDLIEVVDSTALPAQISRDIDDDAVLACALCAKADVIVSGDKDLLVLNAFENMPILTASHALEMLKIAAD